jgi:hypothetical protein
VTLEKDVEQLLREAMHRGRKSFKETLNDAVRSGLRHGTPEKPKRFVVRPREMGLKAGYDPAGFNKLADDLETEAFLEKHEAVRPGRRK